MSYKKEEINKIFNEVCELISENGISLRAVLLRDSMPSSRTFYKWIEEDQAKVKQYACACEDRSDKIFEDILNIADSTAEDIIKDGDGKEQINHNVIQRDRLRVESRKWMLGKMNPKKYSSQMKQHDHTELLG